MGDSITQAATDRGADGGYSYRYWLWRHFVDAQVEVDFVGSQTTASGRDGDPGWPRYQGQTFDRDHEGHSGQTTRYLRDNLPTWLAAYDVDVALIHIGHNDPRRGIGIDQTRQNIIALIQALQADNPHVVILLAKIIPTDPTQPPRRPAFST